MNNDDELNRILMERAIPKPSSNLIYRISQHAEDMTRRKSNHISLMDQILRMLVIPKPAYATAVCLVLGLAIGFYNGGADATSQDWFLFLELEEEGWL